jgi:eight-cysteine-cluster-containing protein
MKSILGLIACLTMLMLAGCGTVDNNNGNSGGSCTPGDTKTADDGCNTCQCDDGGTWSCTEIACETCTDGETQDAGDGCNTCICQDGQWTCTAAYCGPFCPEPVTYEGTCVQQVVYVEGDGGECCEMPDPCSVPDGLKAYNTKKECEAPEPACPAPVAYEGDCAQVITYGRSADGLCCEYPTPCSLPEGVEAYPTLAACEAGSQTCTEGDTQPAGDGCNTCTCQADGSWACTKIGCQPGSCRTDDDCVVTGCSGQLCAAAPTASTCEFLPEYACYRDDVTSCRCNDGVCGWAQTDALATCLGE